MNASGVLFFVFSGTMWSLKVFISSSVYVTIDPGTSSIVASPFCLFEFGLPFSGLCSQDFLVFSLSLAKGVFYTSPRICSLVQNKEEPPDHFKTCFCLFLTIYLFSHSQNLRQHKQKVLNYKINVTRKSNEAWSLY